MKVFITGGAGYLGYSLVNALEQLDDVSEIIVLDNLYHANLNFFINNQRLVKTRFVKGDILDNYVLDKQLKDIDIFYHLAAHVDFPYSYKDNHLYEQINQYGTENLVAHLTKRPPQKVIYISSGAVYGFSVAADEDSLPQPENAYGKSKFEGEKYIQLLRDITEVQILRVGNIFGYNPSFRYDSVINHFMFDALLYNKIKIYGNGEQSRPFIKLSHVVDYLVYGLQNKLPNEIINLVDDNKSLNALRDLMLSLKEELEFTYTNVNLSMKGYEMHSRYYQPKLPFETAFIQEFHHFNTHFCMKVDIN